MKKVLVIGPGGSGKSTFATRLGKLLKIDVIHLDQIYWRPGWIETPKPEWRKTVAELLTRHSWIIDGNYSGTLQERIEASDTVIFLDLPRTLCLWRVLKRNVLYRNKQRPDMAEGCAERFNLEFITWVWNYRRRSRPKVIDLLQSKATTKKVIWLRSRLDAEKFLARQATSNKA
jgi:adenylate kinase family enzyme